jgi:hypothetical protein
MTEYRVTLVCDYGSIESTYRDLLRAKKRIAPVLQYHDLLERILADGVEKQNRTGIDALSVFGHFDLARHFPLGNLIRAAADRKDRRTCAI